MDGWMDALTRMVGWVLGQVGLLYKTRFRLWFGAGLEIALLLLVGGWLFGLWSGRHECNGPESLDVAGKLSAPH
jgi:hypothetical protein